MDPSLENTPSDMAEGVDNTPFFVIGSDRSGTTLLRLMLNAHWRLCVPEESRFIIDLMDAVSLDRVLTSRELATTFDILAGHTRWRQLWAPDDLEEKLKEIELSLRQPRLMDIVDAVFQKFANPRNKPRWGDKTPPQVREIDRLAQVFPGAKFVHIIRDGRDVGLSLKKKKWYGPTVMHTAWIWQDSVSRGRVSGRKLGDARYLEIAYEDLVLQTERTLRRVCELLQEPFDPQMLDYHEHAETALGQRVRKLHAKTMRPPSASDVNRWPDEMSALQVMQFEFIAGPTMELVGQKRRFPFLKLFTPLSMTFRGLGAMLRPYRKALLQRFPRLRRRI